MYSALPIFLCRRPRSRCLLTIVSGTGSHGISTAGPGADTLPLSRAIAESDRLDVPVPGPFLAPLYGLRRWVAGFGFRYDLNLLRFHFGGVIDGTRARRLLGYAPGHPVQWPRAWWRLLVERLANLRSERT